MKEIRLFNKRITKLIDEIAELKFKKLAEVGSAREKWVFFTRNQKDRKSVLSKPLKWLITEIKY